MNVFLLQNPLKTLTVNHRLTNEKNTFVVELFPTYFDLTEGVWSMHLDRFTYKVHKPNFIDTIFKVSCSLVSQYCTGPLETVPSSRYVVLGQMRLVGNANEFDTAHFEKNHFQVQNPARSQFYVEYSEISFLKTPNLQFDIELEITFNFQRLK